MFEPNQDTEKLNVLKVRYAEKRKYISALKKLKKNEFYHFHIETICLLKDIEEFIKILLSEIKNKSLEKYNNQQCKAIVADTYFNFLNTHKSSKSLEMITREILKIVDDSSILTTNRIIEELTKISLKISELVSPLSDDFSDKKTTLQNEKQELSQDFSKEEELYKLYKSLKKHVKKIRKELNVDVPLSDFITSFNKNYKEYLDGKEKSYQEFSRFISIQQYLNSDGEDLILKKKKYNGVVCLLDSYIDKHHRDCILWDYNKLFMDQASKENIQNKISDLTRQLSDADPNFFANYINYLNNAIKFKKYRQLPSIIRNCHYEACNECSDLQGEIINAVQKTIKEKSNDLPYLRFISSDKIKYYLLFLGNKELEKLFNDINILNILFNILNSISENNLSEDDIEYFDDSVLKKVSKIIEIIDQIVAIVPIDEFINYLEYFKYIDSKYELCEQEIIDEKVKNMLLK